MDDTTSIGAGNFKAKCLKLLDQVAETRQALTITKHGKPVARLVPVEAKRQLFGALRSSTYVEGDIISPVEASWDAAR